MKPAIPFLLAALAGGCGNDPSPPHASSSPAVTRSAAATSGPRTFLLCTATQQAGQMCGTEGETCDPADACNRRLLCSREDPTLQPGGCPISLAAWKKDIRYLDEAGRQRQHDAIVRMPLATWRYRTEEAEAPAAPRVPDRRRRGRSVCHGVQDNAWISTGTRA